MLSTLDDQELYLIASKMVPCRFGPGTDLCSEGDAADRLWFLLEGGEPGWVVRHHCSANGGHSAAEELPSCSHKLAAADGKRKARCSVPGMEDIMRGLYMKSYEKTAKEDSSSWVCAGEVAELHHHKLAEEIRGPAVLGQTGVQQHSV